MDISIVTNLNNIILECTTKERNPELGKSALEVMESSLLFKRGNYILTVKYFHFSIKISYIKGKYKMTFKSGGGTGDDTIHVVSTLYSDGENINDLMERTYIARYNNMCNSIL